MKRLSLALLLLLIAAAALTFWHSGANYATQDRDQIAAGATAKHWTGTDELGRDRSTRIAGALLLGFAGAILASAVSTALAVGVGITAALAPRGIASGLMYLGDLFLTLPWLFLLMMVRSALPLTMAPIQSAAITFLLLGLLGWPAYARLSYARAVGIRNAEWLIHGRATGLRSRRLISRHVLPHLLPIILSQFLIGIPAALVAEANLGTLGLGVSDPLPSWGSMLLSLQNSAVLVSSHWAYLPILLLVLVLVLLQFIVSEVS